jgi:hypothetical protein
MDRGRNSYLSSSDPRGHKTTVGTSVLDQGQHQACVDAWLDRSARDRSPDGLCRLFEAALGALWARSVTTLGDVTLTAIAERVLHDAAQTYPLFSSLKVEPTLGIPFRELRERLASVPDAQLVAGSRFVLVQFLTVLGNLTAEILTPELHAALSAVVLPEARGVEKTAQSSAASRVDSEGKGKWS